MDGAAEGNSIQRYLTNLRERYGVMSLRERALVGLGLFATTWMIWSATVGGFIEESETRVARDIDTLYAQMQAEVAEQSRLRKVREKDPNTRLVEERRALGESLESLNSSLAEVLDHFVPPEQMPELLRDVIRNHDGLKLKAMVSLPVEPIEVHHITGVEPEPGEEAPPPAIYRHPMRLEFEGNYFEVLAYLAELERSDWDLGWRMLDYAVADYPTASVVIEIETLSRDRSWIGV